jgi:molybdopterin/thiamine biosynthesis adenylyltransferase
LSRAWSKTTPSERPGSDVDRHRRLPDARVLVVGVGGLGAPAALQLAATGVGTIGLIDADAVELSNLPRQILYRTTDVGRSKARTAAERLSALYPGISVRAFELRLSPANFTDVCTGFDFIIDGTDDIESKYLVNDAAVGLGIPYSHAGVVGLHGQTMMVLPGRSACLRCLFPNPPGEELPTCRTAGVLGPVAGMIAVLQATQAVCWLSGYGKGLADRLVTYDAVRGRWRTVNLSRRKDCAVCADRIDADDGRRRGTGA